MQNSAFWIRIRSLYRFQICCACTTACLATELLVSMGPRPHLWFWLQNSVFWDRIIGLYWSQSSPVVLCRHNSAFWNRITSLYGFQPSPVVLGMQNSYFRTRITCLYGSQMSPVIFCMQNSVPSFRITSLYGSQSSSVFLHSKQRLLDPNKKSLWVPDITCRFVQAIQRD